MLVKPVVDDFFIPTNSATKVVLWAANWKPLTKTGHLHRM